jgi:hypothetical protein
MTLRAGSGAIASTATIPLAVQVHPLIETCCSAEGTQPFVTKPAILPEMQGGSERENAGGVGLTIFFLVHRRVGIFCFGRNTKENFN